MPCCQESQGPGGRAKGGAACVPGPGECGGGRVQENQGVPTPSTALPEAGQAELPREGDEARVRPGHRGRSGVQIQRAAEDGGGGGNPGPGGQPLPRGHQ